MEQAPYLVLLQALNFERFIPLFLRSFMQSEIHSKRLQIIDNKQLS